jgi:hypothetical protein
MTFPAQERFNLEKDVLSLKRLVQENGVWRKRYNREIYELFNEPDIVKYIVINRLGWAGHVIRTDNNRTVKVFNTKPIGIRKI